MSTFYVIQVGRNSLDTHASGSIVGALDLALPDPGHVIVLYKVEAQDAGEARLIPTRANAMVYECGSLTYTTDGRAIEAWSRY